MNRGHKLDDQLFCGCYKSIMIDADTYLLALVRYIHKNTSKANIGSYLHYKWSSHQAYLSDADLFHRLSKKGEALLEIIPIISGRTFYP